MAPVNSVQQLVDQLDAHKEGLVVVEVREHAAQGVTRQWLSLPRCHCKVPLPAVRAAPAVRLHRLDHTRFLGSSKSGLAAFRGRWRGWAGGEVGAVEPLGTAPLLAPSQRTPLLHTPCPRFRPPWQFFGTWCSGCRALQPHLMKLAEEDSSVHWALVDYGANAEHASTASPTPGSATTRPRPPAHDHIAASGSAPLHAP